MVIGFPRRQVVLSFGSAIMIAIFSLSGLYALSPRYAELEPYRVAATDIEVLPLVGIHPTRRKRVGETEYNLLTAHKLPRNVKHQFRLTTQLERPPTRPSHIFLPITGGALVLYMNGVRITSDRGKGLHIAGMSNRYMLATIPVKNYQTGINRLTIVMTPEHNHVGIPRFYLFENDDMIETLSVLSGLQTKRAAHLERVTIIGASLVIIIALIGGFLRVRPKFYATLGAIGGSILALRGFAHGAAERSVFLDYIPALILYCVVSLCLINLWRYLEIRKKPVLFGLWMVAFVAVSICILFLLPVVKPFFYTSLMPIALLGYLPIALAAGGSALIRDHRRYGDFQRALSQKIADQKNLIEAQQLAIEEGLKTKGRLEERQRLTRDIHDGIGGHLLSMLLRVRDGDISSEEIEGDLEYGLNDLRLIVDSMDHSDGTLEAALVTFRSRAEAQLRAANIRLHWHQTDVLSEVHFGPETVLNIYRLLQEAITNAIRHANCENVAISITQEASNLLISVTDDGVGIGLKAPRKAGQGMRNMEFRAKQLGSVLDITDHEDGGTRVTLSVLI
jgi:signal transduction histidine kinase